MSPAANALFAKPKLTLPEMNRLIADSLAELPTVRSVRVEAEDSEVAVRLVCGQTIEFQTMPIASALNGSPDERRAALDSMLKRCA